MLYLFEKKCKERERTVESIPDRLLSSLVESRLTEEPPDSACHILLKAQNTLVIFLNITFHALMGRFQLELRLELPLLIMKC